MLCPVCKKDDQIQKVSSIYSGGTSEGRMSGPGSTVTYSDGKVGVGSTYFSGNVHSSTGLARKLAPPSKPTQPSYPGKFFCGLIILIPFGLMAVWLIIFMIFQGEEGDNSGIAFLIFAIIAAVGIFMVSTGSSAKKKQQYEYQGKINQYNSDIEQWNRWYYCHRDDIIFDPTTEEVWTFTQR